MIKLICYYAHSMLSYNSTQEKEDIELLKALGFQVINPNTVEHEKGCKEYIKNHGASNVMKYFHNIIFDCDLLAFRGQPDGKILSGVASEITFAKDWKKLIIELPCSISTRKLDYPTTKEYLVEIGHYKV